GSKPFPNVLGCPIRNVHDTPHARSLADCNGSLQSVRRGTLRCSSRFRFHRGTYSTGSLQEKERRHPRICLSCDPGTAVVRCHFPSESIWPSNLDTKSRLANNIRMGWIDDGTQFH